MVGVSEKKAVELLNKDENVIVAFDLVRLS